MASARCRTSRFSTPRAVGGGAVTHRSTSSISTRRRTIPSLASAGYLEPLDEYIKKGWFSPRRSRRLRQLHEIRRQRTAFRPTATCTCPVHAQDLSMIRTNRSASPTSSAPTENSGDLGRHAAGAEFLMDPSKDLYGSGNLRNRANGVTWWYMIFYSAGEFPLDDDMKPTIDTPARAIRSRHLSAGQEGEPSGSGQLGHATDHFRVSRRDTLSPASTGTEPARRSQTRSSRRPSASSITASCRARTSPARWSIGRSRRRWRRFSSTSTRRARRRRPTWRWVRKEQHSDRLRSGQRIQRRLGQGAYGR